MLWLVRNECTSTYFTSWMENRALIIEIVVFRLVMAKTSLIEIQGVISDG